MQMRIGGKECSSADAAWFEVKNPATGEKLDRIPAGSADDIDLAVNAAATAFLTWKKKTMRERGMILFHAAQNVRLHHKDLAKLLTAEQGKPVGEATDEIRGFANILEFYAGISAHQEGELIRLGATGDCLVTREPLGVCGAIIPWNMPVLIMGWKVGPALLAGNTLVLKPASTAPLTNLQLGKILDESGLPPGVLNIVTGSGESVGEPLVKHPMVRKISFTGNVATGERIRELSHRYLKAVTLELGGSDPMIVMDDADIDKAVEGAVRGRFYNAGQTCTAVKRLYLHEKIAGEFTRKLKIRVEAMKIGNGLEPKTDMGPLNSPLQRERITGIIEETRDLGTGTVLTGGAVPAGDSYRQGCFYQPTLVTDVSPGSRLVTDEVFGPVLPIVTIPDLDTAIREANNTRFGLGASIWTRDLSTTRRAFDEIRAGIIWVNRHLTVPPEVPFGGTGESGIGRENGQHALDQYSETRTLLMNW